MPAKTESKSIAAKSPAKEAKLAKGATATPRKRTVKVASTAKPKATAAPKKSIAKTSTTTGQAVKPTSKTVQPVAATPVAAFDPAAYHEAVARMAYHLWEHKGRPEGSSELDWRQAEQEIGIAPQM